MNFFSQDNNYLLFSTDLNTASIDDGSVASVIETTVNINSSCNNCNDNPDSYDETKSVETKIPEIDTKNESKDEETSITVNAKVNTIDDDFEIVTPSLCDTMAFEVMFNPYFLFFSVFFF